MRLFDWSCRPSPGHFFARGMRLTKLKFVSVMEAVILRVYRNNVNLNE